MNSIFMTSYNWESPRHHWIALLTLFDATEVLMVDILLVSKLSRIVSKSRIVCKSCFLIRVIPLCDLYFLHSETLRIVSREDNSSNLNATVADEAVEHEAVMNAFVLVIVDVIVGGPRVGPEICQTSIEVVDNFSIRHLPLYSAWYGSIIKDKIGNSKCTAT
jgi:hypothetical protein